MEEKERSVDCSYDADVEIKEYMGEYEEITKYER